MLLKKNSNNMVAIVIGLIVLVAAGFFVAKGVRTAMTSRSFLSPEKPENLSDQAKPEGKKNAPQVVKGTIKAEPEINFKDLNKNPELDQLMADRKARSGVDKSLDMIVQADEKFVVGGQKISMKEILKKAMAKKGEIFQEDIRVPGEPVESGAPGEPGKSGKSGVSEESGAPLPKAIKEYGIYVVRKGDNIWNIHFNILKEFYSSRGISVASRADEPVNEGVSSGVGKILKFSEQMVMIYNLTERQMADDINLLQPLSKIIVYNMGEIFSLLQEVTYENVDRIQFDGTSIWIPVKQS